MSRDDIMRIAQEAGLITECVGLDWCASLPNAEYPRKLERFAALVAAAEREACAKVAEEPYEFTSSEVHRIAAAIRAMGNT
jgi:hypothetical protein